MYIFYVLNPLDFFFGENVTFARIAGPKSIIKDEDGGRHVNV